MWSFLNDVCRTANDVVALKMSALLMFCDKHPIIACNNIFAKQTHYMAFAINHLIKKSTAFDQEIDKWDLNFTFRSAIIPTYYAGFVYR